ncbi:hypothetical protein B0H17DRAFT_1144813 [Mycena rosella]|uniref:Uncharacterized protein n=1 Tax=Mycena rosella TaxID=1033263 RepID=A0AAD7CSD9_MYCRO|nr:hypothetical protein B0H17DRAFT_1144813 [Mycena rosella]
MPPKADLREDFELDPGNGRDIAIQLGDQEGLKHRLTGGWWPQADSDEWQRAGPGVRDVKLVAMTWGQRQRTTYKLKDTTAARTVNFGLHRAESTWFKCRELIRRKLRCVLVVLELFQILSVWDEVFGIPVLVRRDSETTFSILPGKVANIEVTKWANGYPERRLAKVRIKGSAVLT